MWHGINVLKVFVLSLDISDEVLAQMLSLKGNEYEVELLDLHAVPQMARFFVSRHLSSVTYSKIFLDTLIPAYVGRILYLDVDISAAQFPTDLFELSLGDFALGAIEDAALPDRLMGNGGGGENFGKSYFNAGVLLLDLGKIRSRGLMEKARRYASENQADLHDQDALNYAFSADWLPLEPRWNFQTGAFRYRGTPANPSRQLDLCRKCPEPFLVHFTGPEKPWERRVLQPLSFVYFKEFGVASLVFALAKDIFHTFYRPISRPGLLRVRFLLLGATLRILKRLLFNHFLVGGRVEKKMLFELHR